MTDSAAYDALHASLLGAELSETQCRTLAALLSMRELADGEVLVREGTSDNHLYALVAGALAVARGAGSAEEVTLYTLKPGDLVGELSFLDDNIHYASIVSRGASRVFGLTRGQLESLLERDPHVVYQAMRAIARHAHQTQHRLAAQAAELANYVYKQHGRY